MLQRYGFPSAAHNSGILILPIYYSKKKLHCQRNGAIFRRAYYNILFQTQLFTQFDEVHCNARGQCQIKHNKEQGSEQKCGGCQ